MKKLLAFLLTCALLFSCVPVFAEEPAAEEPAAEEPAREVLDAAAYGAFSPYLIQRGQATDTNFKDEFVETEAANMIYASLFNFLKYGVADMQNPALYAYWESLGLKKTIYDADDPDRMWAVYVPCTRKFADVEKFPVVFCLHGNDNDIVLTETYGFAELGGKEGFITVIPWAKNEDIIVEEIPRIMGILRENNYPVDETRIYATGFSKGGRATQNVALAYSELFAACAPGGMYPFGVDESAGAITSGAISNSFTREAFDNAYTMPTLFFGGTSDRMPINTTAVNEWLKLSGAVAPEYTDELFAFIASKSAYSVERMTGLSYQTLGQMEIRHYDGQNYFIGSYYNADGVCTFRAVAVEGAPHWLMPSEAKVVWEFLKQFGRDTETHEIFYIDK